MAPPSVAEGESESFSDHKEQELHDVPSEEQSEQLSRHPDEADLEETSLTEVPQGRQVGVVSATFLMINRILGTGVFSTTSTILEQSGSVGMSLIYWVIGGIIAGVGFAVYAEFATAIPRNGAELNYLQYVFRKPRYLVVSMYACLLYTSDAADE